MNEEKEKIEENWTEEPKKSKSHDSIIYNYFHSADREHYRSGANVSFVEDTLYSYGEHFILATRLNQGGFLINADHHSSSTSAHTNMCIANSPIGTPQIPFSALIAAGIHNTWVKDRIKRIEITEKNNDKYTNYSRTNPKTGKKETYSVHDLGMCLFKFESRYFISGIDEGSRNRQYFLIELPEPTKTVEAALELISGLSPRNYEKYKAREILRQGEYFLHPTGTTEQVRERLGIPGNEKLQTQKNVDLYTLLRHDEEMDLRHHPHIATECFRMAQAGTIFVRGTIRHPEHKMVSLKNIWHIVTINNVLNSWTATGSVD